MPRVSLLLADGVGLGKTIQAGLVLEELLLRRRIRRVLVLCPAMLQRQWRLELRRKFNLEFEIIDSDSTFQLRRRLGIDTNPWKAFPRIITSMDYLRMPDVLQQFLQGSGVDEVASDGRVSPHATWDLLIVDEAHHFAPQSGSQRCALTNACSAVGLSGRCSSTLGRDVTPSTQAVASASQRSCSASGWRQSSRYSTSTRFNRPCTPRAS